MKFLLVQNIDYIHIHGGATKSNRMLAQALVQAGHHVETVSPFSPPAQTTLNAAVSPLKTTQAADISEHNGVCVHLVLERRNLRDYLLRHVESYQPDWILISSEEPSHSLLEADVRAVPHKVIYLAHTVQYLPFGPLSFAPGERRATLLNKVGGIIAISKFVKNYIKEWSGLDTFLFHPPHYGAPPYAECGKFDNPYIMQINPSQVKGVEIFAELARRFPTLSFAAVHSSTFATSADLLMLRAIANVTILEPTSDLDALFSRCKVVLVPSVAHEGFGMVCVDAMLRGVPVLASNVGGLPEAKLGVDYLLPVNAISAYKDEAWGENLLPVLELPEQNIRPWENALREITSNKERYERISSQSREKAQQFVRGLTVAPLENWLANKAVVSDASHD